MSKPDDIPQDVWDMAANTLDDHAYNPLRVIPIARAIMAAKAEEREACAKLVDDAGQNQRKTALHSLKWGVPEDTANHRYMADRHAEVAAAIRKRGEAAS